MQVNAISDDLASVAGLSHNNPPASNCAPSVGYGVHDQLEVARLRLCTRAAMNLFLVVASFAGPRKMIPVVS